MAKVHHRGGNHGRSGPARRFAAGAVVLAAAVCHGQVVVTPLTGTPEGGLFVPQFVSDDGTAVAGYEWVGAGSGIAHPTRAHVTAGGPVSFSRLEAPGPGGSGGTTGISADGNVIVGWHTAGGWSRPMAWHRVGNVMQVLATPAASNGSAMGVSADGTTIAGYALPGPPCLWIDGVLETLPLPPNATSAAAMSISGDGTVTIGEYGGRLLVWDAQGFHYHQHVMFLAMRLSRDGGTVVGLYSENGQVRVQRWTASGGTQTLPAYRNVMEFATTGDGSMVVGTNVALGSEPRLAWVWSEQAGLQTLAEYLLERGADLSGWDELNAASGISADGKIILGYGRYQGTVIGFHILIDEGCYANCDESTVPPVLNVDDFTCFINEFAAGSMLSHEEQITHYANCDGSTVAPVLNVDDFTCFINAFAQGCP